MRKIITLICGLAFCMANALAVPAKRTPIQVQQADGSTLTIYMVGDEHFHYHMTTDGVPVMKGADGSFYYASISNNQLVATRQLAHAAEQRSDVERQFIASAGANQTQMQALNSQRLELRNEQRAARRLSRALNAPTPKAVGESGTSTGKRKGLVILVNYKDLKMSMSDPKKAFDEQFNKVGYSANGNRCSVHDYFLEQSYGQLDLEFDVVGPYTVSKNMSYYGENDSFGYDMHAEEMVYEACKLADADVNYKDYDWDGDGEVDQVYVIYAGHSEASDQNETHPEWVWPHEYELSYAGYNLTCDGVKVNTYGCSSELYGDSGSKMDGIGTACHEFSHCLGLPDLYDTNNQTNFGMDMWSVMDSGCYGGDGYSPVGYTAYERWFSGWMTPKELKDGCNIENMKAITDAPEAYIIYNEAKDTEYYILENRQQRGADIDIPGHGMLVIHVDYSPTIWANNTINNTASRQRCTIIPADNSQKGYYYGLTSLKGDPYPGTTRNTKLTNTSIPAATLYNKNSDGTKFMNKPIEEIKETTDGLISFKFNGGGDDTGIADVTTDAAMADFTPVSVYTTAGQRVGEMTYGAFTTSSLPAGIYLLKSAQGTKKVIK